MNIEVEPHIDHSVRKSKALVYAIKDLCSRYNYIQAESDGHETLYEADEFAKTFESPVDEVYVRKLHAHAVGWIDVDRLESWRQTLLIQEASITLSPFAAGVDSEIEYTDSECSITYTGFDDLELDGENEIASTGPWDRNGKITIYTRDEFPEMFEEDEPDNYQEAAR